MQADYENRQLNGEPRNNPNSRTATIIIPVTAEQYTQLLEINKRYCDKTPYDYAFFGMRCAAATQDVLSQVGILKKKNRLANIVSTFYPKKLRKRLFRLAEKNNYQVLKTVGRDTRKWEKD